MGMFTATTLEVFFPLWRLWLSSGWHGTPLFSLSNLCGTCWRRLQTPHLNGDLQWMTQTSCSTDAGASSARYALTYGETFQQLRRLQSLQSPQALNLSHKYSVTLMLHLCFLQVTQFSYFTRNTKRHLWLIINLNKHGCPCLKPLTRQTE